MTDFSKLLNPEQCAAATAGDGPLLVLAAAGTGKTCTLVHRVAYLIEKGVPPERILLLTFTNRAAREMLERSEKVVGPCVSGIWSGTFHSICARLLRRYCQCVGFKQGFQIIDEEDQKKLVGDIIKKTVKDPKEFPKRDYVAKMISDAANEDKPIRFIAARWQSRIAGVDPEAIAKIADEYAARKRELNSMDFDDLLVYGLKLLRENEGIRTQLQEHFLYVLVDEYQDTNGLQSEFTDLLAAKHRNIMAVGDDFQCIYTWRGAKIENILEFPRRWEGCRTVKLERNYRSVGGVLDVANIIMRDAPNQFEKILKSVRGSSGERPWHYVGGDGRSQSQEIVRIIREAHDDGYRWSDIAVLYRSHFQSIDVQMSLGRMKVPHRITSGVGVFEQIHVKDTLAYLRLIVNPTDELSFLRFVALLPGVGEVSAKRFWEKLGRKFDPKREEDRDALAALLGNKAMAVWPQLATGMRNVAEHFAENEIGEIIEDFLDFFYEDHLRDEWEESDAEDRLNDIKELAAQIAGSEGGLEAFLADVALLTNLDANRNDPQTDRVTLSTIHQAKGMEWPVVIVPWCSDGMFPSGKALEEGRTDEERRLFYVVVTRAKDRLHLFSPAFRSSPDGGSYPVEISTFLREVPAELLNKRRIYSIPSGYGNPYGRFNGGASGRNGYGSGSSSGRSGYGGGYSNFSRSSKPDKSGWKTVWRH